MRICTIEGCGRKHDSDGFCKKHYGRYHRYGNPLYWCRGDANVFTIENDIVKVEIPHTNAHFIVDAIDWNQLKQYSWYLKNPGYICANINNKTIYLHRFIMQAKKGELIDHIDRNKLNNSRSNLRFSDFYKNAWNSVGYGNTGIKGVRMNKKQKYIATIMRNNQTFRLGTFNNIDDAKNAYIAKALEFHDETYL